MTLSSNSYAVAPAVILNFLKKTFPFTELEHSTLSYLARHCVIDHFPRGTMIFRQDHSDVAYFHLVQKGGVKAYLTSEDMMVSLKEYCGEGESFGALPILSGQKADFSVEAVEDTFCFLIEKDAFLKVINDNPGFGKYYLEKFSEDHVCALYSELRLEKVRERPEETNYLFNYRVRDVIKDLPEYIAGSATIQEAGVRMSELRCDALLVQDQTGAVIGMLSTRDLREKVVAEGLDYSTPVAEVVDTPLRAIPAQALCFDALLLMMRSQTDHLAVEHRKNIVGVVSAHDIIVYQGASFLYPFREIASQRRTTGLHSIALKIPIIVRALLEEGARAGAITEVITLFNDNLLDRLLTLLMAEQGPPPARFCWMMLGSEGRREKTFTSDQDHALLYEDLPDEKQLRAAERYLASFADKAVNHLEACGFARCRQKLMASNPRWRQPQSRWHKYFDDWMLNPIPPDVSVSKVFLDFRSGYGDPELADRLRTSITARSAANREFLTIIAQDFMARLPPVSVFGGTVVEHNGEHSNQFDLKVRGLTPFVDFARLMALAHGVPETSTLARLKRLYEDNHVPKAVYTDLKQAYEFQIHLCLVNQLRLLDAGRPPDNIIQPARLSDLERRTLKDIFSIMEQMRQMIRRHFRIFDEEQ